jgi:SAM-dependent methyltransferase
MPPDDHARIAQIFADCAAGAIPPNIALMRLLMSCETASNATDLIETALAARGGEPLREMRRLATTHSRAWDTIHRVLGEVSHDRSAPTVRDWIADFDRAAAISPEAGVALYSLGSPALLAAATDELIAHLRAWGLLRPHRRVLDLGCGIGRLIPGLAGESAFVVGAEISPAMLDLARARCIGLSNVGLLRVGGDDLSCLADGAFDLILAVDSFPYIMQSGISLARRLFGEMARVLAPGADLVIFNFSYRGDTGRDRDDIRALAAETGLTVRRNGSRELKIWDGAAFHLSRDL